MKFLLAAFLLLPLVALAAAAPIRVPVDELQVGQTGYGLTVFQGTEPDTFDVTILGVQHGSRAGGDVILVELSGHDLQRSAVAQGMSGSPVYLDDGRLLGAVAFGWPGALRPIAGLTPATELDLVRDRTGHEYAVADYNSAPAVNAMALLGTPATSGLAAALLPGVPLTAMAPNTGDPWPTAESLATRLLPTMTSQPDGPLVPLDLSLFAVPVGAATAATAATATTVAPTLVPGSACAVALITGDAQLGAVGTVSLVEGGRIVCMAHPFLQMGPVDLPLATAEIVTVFPSRQMSFKMGAAGTVVGRITHDLRGGLAGDLGIMAPTAPVTVEVELPSGRRTFDFEVAQQQDLTPQLVFWCLYNAVLAEGDDRSNQLVSYDVTYELADRDGIAIEPVSLSGVSGGAGGVGALAADWQAPLQILLRNRHRPLTLTRVTANLRVERPLRVAWIRALHAPAMITPGRPFTVEVELESRFGPVWREVFEFTAPAGLVPGSLRLGAASAREFFQLDAMRAGGLFDDHGLAATLDLLNRPRSLDELTVALVQALPGFTAGGRELANLPPSVQQTLASGPPTAIGTTMATYLLRAARPTGLILQGNAVQDVEVRLAPAPRPEGDRP